MPRRPRQHEPARALTGGMLGSSVGIDVGGTFTDLVAVAPDGAVTARKVLTTPGDQSEGVLAALVALAADPTAIGRLAHGTTVATNTLLERNGGRVALCATDGATDLLELRRQDRASLYDLTAHHPAALVAAADVVPVAERIAPSGIVTPLSDAAADSVVERVAALAPDIVAVVLLHAFARPDHERRLGEAIRSALPGTAVILSSDVLPEIREYERCATTVAEAYLRHRVTGYLGRLGVRLSKAGYPPPMVMTSSAGMLSADDAARSAAALALSGPAGGVTGAAVVLRALGIDRALTIDIGGTSADVGLVLDGEPLIERGGAVAGVPIALPRVLVETVAAGGGSIAWIDDGGALRVGPRSAGAVPGPAAFGRGGVEATLTDAHLVLGNIEASRLSGAVALDAGAATAAVGRLAAHLDAPVARVAEAIVATADAEMARALRRVSVERGVDPRGCVLVAFGGGGPLHACALAAELGMTRVLVPPFAGVLSALGLALAPERREALGSIMRRADSLDDDSLAAVLPRVTGAGRGAERRSFVRARYEGQGHELDVPVGEGGGEAAARAFVALHGQRYGFTLDRPVELVSARSVAVGEHVPATLARRGTSSWDPTRRVDTGAALDATVAGRATIALADATLLVGAGWAARALAVGGWMIERHD